MNRATAAQPQTESSGGLRLALTREALAYALILLVALALRAPRLGAPPLSQREARAAMAAWHLLNPGPSSLIVAESPLVLAGTVLTFAVFGASDAGARLLPMLAGSGLALLPLTFRKHFGRLPMLIASVLLALSPGAIAASRHVDGSGAAVLCTLLALAALWRHTQSGQAAKLVASGMWLGLALLADFSTWLGLAGLLFGAGALVWGDDQQGSARGTLLSGLRDVRWSVFVGALALTIFLTSTLLLTYPRGLGAAADLLGRLVRGMITRPPGTPFLGGLLLLYEPLLLTFGLIGLTGKLASTDARERFLSGWAAGAILVGFAYPGGLPAHSLWMTVPLAALAGLELADVLAPPEESGPTWSLLLQAGLVIAMLSVATLWAVSFLGRPLQGEETLQTLVLRLALVGSMLLLVTITTLLWTSIWGNVHAWRGLALGLLGMGLLVSVTGSAGLAYARASDPHEPWNVAPGQPALDALTETARDVSNVATGHPLEATITVQGSPDGLLAWALRDFRRVTFVEQLSPQVQSDMLLAVAGEEPQVGERYVGQDFVIVRAWGPSGLTFDQAMRWVFLREATTPSAEVRVVLWVREDIYLLLPNEVR